MNAINICYSYKISIEILNKMYELILVHYYSYYYQLVTTIYYYLYGIRLYRVCLIKYKNSSFPYSPLKYDFEPLGILRPKSINYNHFRDPVYCSS